MLVALPARCAAASPACRLAVAAQRRRQTLHTIRGTVVDAKTIAPIADARSTLVEPARHDANGRGRTLRIRERAARHVHAHGLDHRLHLRAPARRRLGAGTDSRSHGSAGRRHRHVPGNRHGRRPTRPRRPRLGVSSQMELGSAALPDLRGVAADDPMRAMQALPGVATGDDFQARVLRARLGVPPRRHRASTARRRRCCCTRSAARTTPDRSR